MKLIWWGLRWPWRWRFYYVRRPEMGWAEIMLGFVSIVWAIDPNKDKHAAHKQDGEESRRAEHDALTDAMREALSPDDERHPDGEQSRVPTGCDAEESTPTKGTVPST